MKYYIGIVLISFAFISSIYFIYSNFLLYSIVIYTLGAVAILLSSKKIIIKLLAIVLPLVLWVPIIWLVSQVSKHFDKTHHKIDLIVSDNFNGTVIIINDLPCAQPLPVYRGREQFDIPDSGVILYNDYADINGTWSNFYVKSSHGQKTEIYPSWTGKSKKAQSKNANTIEVHSLGNSSVSLILEDSMYTFRTTTVYIGSTLTDEFYKLGNSTEQKHNVIDSLLGECLLGK